MSAAAQAEDYTWSDNGDSTCTITDYTGPGGDIATPDTLGGLRVTSIGGSAFYYCQSLTSITIGNSVTDIGKWAFSNCFYLSNVTIPNSVTSIEDYTFNGCSRLTRVMIGNGVSKIGDSAFKDCSNLAAIRVPNSVTTIGSFAFYSCSRLTGVYFTGDAPVGDFYAFKNDENATAYYLPWTTGWGATYEDLPTAVWPLAAADVDIDGYVDLIDFALFTREWLQADCDESNNWCGRTDFDQSGDVGPLDLVLLAEYWLDASIWTPSVADVDLDGEVDLYDFSVLGLQWDQTDCDASNDWCNWADFNKSGMVDEVDLSLLADDWLYGIMP